MDFEMFEKPKRLVRNRLQNVCNKVVMFETAKNDTSY